jgi:glutathione S-transferase
MRVIFWTFVRTPEPERDLAAAARARDAAERLWRIVDAQLARTGYVADGGFSIADIVLGCFVHRWFALPVERAELPALAGWYERLQERPGYRKWVAVPMS